MYEDLEYEEYVEYRIMCNLSSNIIRPQQYYGSDGGQGE